MTQNDETKEILDAVAQGVDKLGLDMHVVQPDFNSKNWEAKIEKKEGFTPISLEYSFVKDKKGILFCVKNKELLDDYEEIDAPPKAQNPRSDYLTKLESLKTKITDNTATDAEKQDFINLLYVNGNISQQTLDHYLKYPEDILMTGLAIAGMLLFVNSFKITIEDKS